MGEMLTQAVRNIPDSEFDNDECCEEIKEMRDLIRKIEKNDNKKDNEKELNCKCIDAYDFVIKTDETSQVVSQVANNENAKYKPILDNLPYYGAVEKDFATIINPKKAGPVRFWRLINYFWSAFFSIFIPLCEMASVPWYSEVPSSDSDIGISQEQYKQILEDFPSRIREVIEFFRKNDRKLAIDKNTGNYYSLIKKAFPCSTAITTNYTPLVEHYFGENSIYLSGKLSEFEFPKELRVEDICNSKTAISEKDFVFPFLMTQAPIKPIIAPSQIKQYANAVEKLNEADTLVIIGYSLGEEDNHIISILRDYIVHDGKRLIYCKYCSKKSIDTEVVKNSVFDQLKIYSDRPTDRLTVLHNNGCAGDLLKQIENSLHSKEMALV